MEPALPSTHLSPHRPASLIHLLWPNFKLHIKLYIPPCAHLSPHRPVPLRGVPV